jgi:RND family efflux transporter MFP subunit
VSKHRISKTILIVILIAILVGGYWLFSRGYIRIGQPASDGSSQGELESTTPQGAAHAGQGNAQPSGEKKILYWQDPMHPAYTSDKPGTAPDCGMDLVPVYAGGGGPESSATNLPPGTVKITPIKQQLIGVQLGQVEYGLVTNTIRAVARLMFDETRITRIHPKISGWIDKVFVDYTGQLVKKGQPLFTIYSPELLSTQEEFLIGLKAKQYLSDSQFKEVSVGAASLYNASRRRLQLWDINEDQIRELERTQKPLRDLTLYAPMDGFVTKRNAFPQQQVTPDTELYELADLSTIWVVADIYEYELPEVHLGQTAKVTLSYFPGDAFIGKVSYIYPGIDNTTRTAKVRIDLPNPGFKLKPDMYANVELQINYGKQISVPDEAVLDSGSEQTVFVSLGDGYFEPRKVQLGGKLKNRDIVLSGLKAGETIVISGNFLIDSESRMKSAVGGMAGMPGMGPGGSDANEKKPSSQGGQAPDHSQHQTQAPQQQTPMDQMPGMNHATPEKGKPSGHVPTGAKPATPKKPVEEKK